jgi:hypothetical protein
VTYRLHRWRNKAATKEEEEGGGTDKKRDGVPMEGAVDVVHDRHGDNFNDGFFLLYKDNLFTRATVTGQVSPPPAHGQRLHLTFLFLVCESGCFVQFLIEMSILGQAQEKYE